jgi:hypothetical protein
MHLDLPCVIARIGSTKTNRVPQTALRVLVRSWGLQGCCRGVHGQNLMTSIPWTAPPYVIRKGDYSAPPQTATEINTIRTITWQDLELSFSSLYVFSSARS